MKEILFLFPFLLAFLPVQAQEILGPANMVRAIREISPNGRYVVGQTMTNGFIWDTENGNNIHIFPEPSEAFFVTDDKFVAGIFEDPNYIVNGKPIRSGGYSTDGQTWTSLGLGFITHPAQSTEDASYVRSGTADGTKIAGFSRKLLDNNTVAAVPSVWTKNENEWEVQEWAHPDNIRYASIIDMTADGDRAVGYVTLRAQGNETFAGRNAILWKSPAEYEIPFEDLSDYTEYTCISANGKYAGYRWNGQAGVHNLETGVKTLIPQGIIINGISNNGLAVGDAFVWSEAIGFRSFEAFLSASAPEFLDKTTPLGQTFSTIRSAGYSLRSITPDGTTFAIQTATPQAYLLKLAAIEEPLPYPSQLESTVSAPDRNKVTLNWLAPETAQKPLTGYAVFRNDEEIGKTTSTVLTYIEENVPVGYHDYTVKAIYENTYSLASNTTRAAIVDTYALPFKENFASKSIETNFWTSEKELGTENSPNWNCDAIGADSDGIGLVFSANNSSGRYDASFVSKYLDGKEIDKVYLSFLTKSHYISGDQTITPDSLWIDVYDGEEWTTVWKSTYKLVMEWKAEIMDVSPVAAGKLFKVRFRIRGVNNTSNAKYSFFDDITVSTALPDGNAVPRNILAKKEGEKIHLVWQDASSESYALTYAASSAKSSIGNKRVNFIAANRFDESDLSIYGDMYLNSISAYIVQKAPEPKEETKLKLAVFDNDTRIVEQDITEFTANAWNTFPIDEPILLKGKNLKFGIEVAQHDSTERPVGMDVSYNPVTGKGDLYSEDGGKTWKTLTATGRASNWCIIGNVSAFENEEGLRNLAVIGYNVYKEGVKINDDLIFGQSLVTTDNAKESCYTLRAYSIASEGSGISDESEEKCISGNVAIHHPEYNKPKVYPSVTSDILHIKSDGAVKNISLYDAAGYLVKYINHATPSISLKDLAKGLYVVKIQTAGEKSAHKIMIL